MHFLILLVNINYSVGALFKLRCVMAARKPAKRPIRIPPYLSSRIGPGKLTHTNAARLIKLVHDGKLTPDQLRDYALSGLHPRTMNSHVKDHERGIRTLEDILESGRRAAERQVPKELRLRILDAPEGEFGERLYRAFREHRPPYTFVWRTALRRVRRRDPKGGWFVSKGIRDDFEGVHQDYYHMQRRRFRLQRQLKGAKTDQRRKELEARLAEIRRELKYRRSVLVRLIAHM